MRPCVSIRQLWSPTFPEITMVYNFPGLVGRPLQRVYIIGTCRKQGGFVWPARFGRLHSDGKFCGGELLSARESVKHVKH